MLDLLGFDWVVYFYPAIQAMLQGRDPYLMPDVVSPPWLFWLLTPLAFLAPWQGAAILAGLTLIVLVVFCGRRGYLWVAIPLALSYPAIMLVWNGQVDALTLLALMVRGPVGLLLLAAKPQTAIFVALIWAWQAWREGGWRKLLILVAPTVIVFVLSVWLYPNWLPAMVNASRRDYSTNGFPWSLALGAAVLVAALRQQREDLASLATILIAPYANIQSWVPALTLLAARYRWETVAACAASWLIPIWLLTHR